MVSPLRVALCRGPVSSCHPSLDLVFYVRQSSPAIAQHTFWGKDRSCSFWTQVGRLGIGTGMTKTLRELSQDREEKILDHPLATRSSASLGRQREEAEDPIRLSFQRDAHRILHCTAFRRLRYKTQVIFSPESDHVSTRVDHSLYMASIAQTISRALGLNQDLAYAIALGHDLGHGPFGHAGETALDKLWLSLIHI